METLASGTVIAKRYTVVQVLGQGGMAAVYEVMNHKLGTPCALKVLTLTARSVRRRLEREGQVQAGLAHPNIVSVFDVVDVDGAPGLLMELVRGPALDQLLAEQQLTFDQCDALARGILAGLEAAHEKGLIHRDLKPANILCSIANGQLIPKIADFGLAKIVADESGANNPSATKSGTTMGTPSYMAPEQIRNANKVDQRADIFSLGAILYELVCGRKAFEGEDLLELFTNVAAGNFKRPRDLRADIPDRMERAILGALTPDRDARIRDVSTLAAVWNGDRDEWTREFDPSAPVTNAGPWDATLLSKYRSANTSASGDTGATTGGALTPMSPSARGPVSGATYTEEVVAAKPPPVVVARPPRSLAPVAGSAALLVATALVLVALVSVAVGAAFYLTVGPHRGPALAAWTTPPAAPVEQPEVAPAPEEPVLVVEPAAIPEVPVAAPVTAVVLPPAPIRTALRPAPVEVVPPEPEPAPAPEPEPEPVAPSTVVQVNLRGDARKVFLQGSDRNHALPAALSPGTYTVRVFFGNEDPIETGKLTLKLGEPKTLNCSSSLRTCK